MRGGASYAAGCCVLLMSGGASYAATSQLLLSVLCLMKNYYITQMSH